MSPLISFPFLKRQSDARLVTLARAGNDRAFETLVERHRPALLSYARRLLGADVHAEDALQQALLQAWVALRADAEPLEAKPWLFRIVHNASINLMRRRQLKCVELNEALDTAGIGDVDAQLTAKETLAYVAALPELQRRAIVLTAFGGSSHEEAAATLGVTDGAVRGLVHRARTSLRRAAAAVLPTPVAAGAGSAGVGGLLLKGGAVALTAGVLATAVHVGVPNLFSPTPRDGSASAVAGVARASRAAGSGREQPGAAVVPAGAKAPGAGVAAGGTARAVDTRLAAARSGSNPAAGTSARHDRGSLGVAGPGVLELRHASGRGPGDGPMRSRPPDGHDQGSGSGADGGRSGGDGGGSTSSSGPGGGGGTSGSGSIGGVSGSDGGGGTSGGSSGSGGSDGGTQTLSRDGGSGLATSSGSGSGDSGSGSHDAASASATSGSSGSDGGSGSSGGGSAATSTATSTSGSTTTSTSGSTTTSTSGSMGGSSGSDG